MTLELWLCALIEGAVWAYADTNILSYEQWWQLQRFHQAADVPWRRSGTWITIAN